MSIGSMATAGRATVGAVCNRAIALIRADNAWSLLDTQLRKGTLDSAGGENRAVRAVSRCGPRNLILVGQFRREAKGEQTSRPEGLWAQGLAES